MNRRHKLGLTVKIIIAMVAGIVLGLGFNLFLQSSSSSGGSSGNYVEQWLLTYVVGQQGVFALIGEIFVKSLKMLVVPVVFVSLVCGVGSLKDVRQLGRVGTKTVALYMGTTVLAITLALIMAVLVSPGKGFDLPTSVSFSAKDTPSLYDVILNIFPSNPVQSMVEGNMLQIIFFSILFGIGIVLVGDRGQKLAQLFEDANEVIMKMIGILMAFAPFGVFCLLAKIFAEQGFEAIVRLSVYFILVLVVLLIHGLVTYPLILKLGAGLNPISFFSDMRAPIMFAFSTASSNATLPITLESVEHRLGVKNSIASFTIPLGATINMDGTAIMQGCATVFIAQAYNVPLTLLDYIMVIVTATLASIGTAGVPGVGTIMLAMVFKQVGLPVEGIGIILGVDRLLDMTRTAVNVTGDAMVTCLVAKSEGALDEDIYNSYQPLDEND